MAERINFNHEQNNTPEDSSGFSPENNKPKHEAHEIAEKPVSAETIRKIEDKVEQAAKSSKELNTHNEAVENKATHQHHGPYREHSGAQAIKRVQKHLRPAERRFSKVIHNPKVEIISDIAGGTVARPSGLLYGGVFALLSSLSLYLLSRHYGYEYSYFVGIIFFVGGFVFGLLVESLARIFKKPA